VNSVIEQEVRMATFACVRGFLSSRKLVQILGVCLAICLTCVPAFSQGSAGRIDGTILDQSGGAIPAAKVTVTDVDRGVSRTLMTDSAGAYSAPNLNPGAYSVRVEFQGFRTVDRKDISLSVGQELRVDVTMQPGEQAQTVTVTGEAPQVNTTSAVLGGTLGPGTIQDLPLNGRNFMNLLQLRPGVFFAPGGGAWYQTTNGLRPEHNVYILDGITAMEPLGSQSTINSVSLAGDSASLLPLDTIQEFATQQNPKAEFGWKPGSITSIALKSGTNAYHGTANAFGRTDATDARNPFLTGDQKQEIALENFGATLGGPIKKDKLFFFGSYEGQRYVVGNPAHYFFPSMAPNAAAIPGATASVVQACNNVKRGGVALSPTSLKMAGLDANCNRTSGYSIFDLPSGSFNRINGGAEVTGNLNTEYNVDGYLGKIDYNLNDKNIINAKYYYGTHRGLVVNSQTITQPYWRPTDNAQLDFVGGQWNYIATSALFNTLRVGYNYFSQQFETTDCPGSGAAPDYGIPFGYGTPPVCGFTNITLTGFDGQVGCCANFAKYYGPDHIGEIIESLSYLKGRHNLKMGGEYRRSEATGVGTFSASRGRVTFGNGGTFGGVPFTTLENFMAGTPTSNGQILIGDPRRDLKSKAYALFFQDDWRIMPRLMLNLGIRYEYVPPFTEGDNRLSNFIPGIGFTQLGKNTDQMFNPDKNNFAPRLGFAWDVTGNGKTVLRGGANMMYVNPGWWIFVSQQNQNNPITGLTTNPSGLLLCRGAVNLTGAGCAAGVATDPTIGTIATTGLPLPPASASGVLPGQINWNQSPAAYGGNLYPSSSDTSVLKCGTNRLCTAQATDLNLKNAYVFSWSLGLQRALTNNLSLDIGYVGNHATKLLGLNYTNTPPYGAGYCLGFTAAQRAAVGNCPTTITASTNTNATAIQLARPLNALYPYLSYIYTVQNLFHSNYNGLQAALTQRVSHGLSYTVGFTFAHALDQSPGERGGPNGTPFDFRHDYASGDFDVRKRLTATITYALPGKKGFGQLAEGWKLTSIVSVQSALPWGIYGSRGADPAGFAEFSNTTSAGDQWNFYGNPKDFSDLKTDAVPFFAPSAAVNNPACTSRVGPPGSLSYVSLQKWGCYVKGGSVMVPPAIGSFGNMTRNIFRGSGFSNWDASVMKDFKFGEKFTAQVRIEAFNILNQTRYANQQLNGPGANLPFGNTNIFGASQSTPDVGNNNPSLGIGGPREFQFGLKLSF
jgi:hypothetical protein